MGVVLTELLCFLSLPVFHHRQRVVNIVISFVLFRGQGQLFMDGLRLELSLKLAKHFLVVVASAQGLAG